MKYLNIRRIDGKYEDYLIISVKNRVRSIFDLAFSRDHPFITLLGIIGGIILRQRVVKGEVVIEWFEDGVYNRHTFPDTTHDIFKLDKQTIKEVTISYVVYYKYSIDEYIYGQILESINIEPSI